MRFVNYFSFIPFGGVSQGKEGVGQWKRVERGLQGNGWANTAVVLFPSRQWRWTAVEVLF